MLVENPNKRIECLQTDCRGKYMSKEFWNYYKQQGIRKELIPIYSL
uniref:Integrase catalytic domain-containing protein n=2 Tax=Physcomitrium patens TaxID=3218 RepID=A0A7I4EXB8_PHYPA